MDTVKRMIKMTPSKPMRMTSSQLKEAKGREMAKQTKMTMGIQTILRR